MTFHSLALTRTDQVQTPCQADPDRWFNDHPKVVASAIADCHRCPLIDACRKATAEILSQVGPAQMHGTWAGQHYLPAGQQHRKVIAA